MLKQALKTKTTQENKTNKVAEKKNRKKEIPKRVHSIYFGCGLKGFLGGSIVVHSIWVL